MKGGSDGKTSSKPGNHKDKNRSACQWVDAWNRWAKQQTVKTLQQKHCITKNWVLPRIIKITQHFIFARQPRQTTTHVMKNAARVAWHHTKKATQRHGETTKKTREWVGTACNSSNNSPAPPATPLQVRRLAKFKFRGSTKAVFDTIVAVSSSPFPTRPLTHVCTDAGLAPGTTRQTDFPLS